MKEKNRFSVLLEHLTSMANLKNYTIAKAVLFNTTNPISANGSAANFFPLRKTMKLFFKISASVL